MKTVTVTALMTLLVAIPLILAKKRANPLPGPAKPSGPFLQEELKYDIDDFLT